MLDERIKNLIGMKFEDGGRGPDSYDCWGLVREIYKRYGIELPDYNISCYDNFNVTKEMENNRPFWQKISVDNAPVPCIVAFRVSSPMVNHVGIYLGENKFIHTREKAGAVIEDITSPAWKHRIEGFYSIRSFVNE